MNALNVVRRFLPAVLIPVYLAVSACAHSGHNDPCVNFGDAVYCLQPGGGDTVFSSTQKVALATSSTTERLIMQVESDANGLRMAGLTPFGRRLFVVSVDSQQRIDVQSDVPLDDGLTAPQMLAGVQLALWPRARLTPGLRGTAVLTEDAGGTRRLLSDGVARFSATCDGARPDCRRAVIRYEKIGRTLTIEASDGEP